MGLWDEKDMSFPEACENLVHAVASKMNIRPNSTVLDVGFGCGDSCIMLADQYRAKVMGVTNESSQWRIANNRLKSSPLKENISLVHGSADNLEEVLSANDTFDHIICIDSAYHYNTRWNFLETVFKKLNQNGSIGLYDLAIEPDFLHKATSLQRRIFQFVCESVHVPIQNLVTVEEYADHLENIGYEGVEIDQLDRNLVFGGLSHSFDTQYNAAAKYGIGISLSNRIFLKVSSFLFGLLRAKPWLVPIIVKGVKQQQ
ncbi:S-adenosyl-L-methionine-dependent methyltransferase [Parasitella parasitica]|nr:S-adenosyl-L-methionine-dependent methyltransferase [Parasitella parasitica]